MSNDMQIIRQQTVAGQAIVFDFDVNFIAVRVKNLTDGNLYVGFNPGPGKEQMALIPPDCAEDFASFYNKGADKAYILPEGAGEVEVRCLKW